jgi:hypothetical protein
VDKKIERLSDDVLAQLNRLQVTAVPEAEQLAEQTRRVDTPSGPRELPLSIHQFAYGFEWNGFELEGAVGHRDVWMLELNVTGELYQSGFARAYYMVGHYDGGNYMLLVDLDDSDPTNPEVFSVDHDPDPDDEGDPAYSFDCRLDIFLASIVKKKRSRG